MPKVFVLNDMHHNFEKAKKHGELVYVTKGKVPIFRINTMNVLLTEGLKDFDVDEDYLLISGPAIMGIMASNIVSSKGQIFKVLLFDAKIQDYIVRHLQL